MKTGKTIKECIYEVLVKSDKPLSCHEIQKVMMEMGKFTNDSSVSAATRQMSYLDSRRREGERYKEWFVMNICERVAQIGK